MDKKGKNEVTAYSVSVGLLMTILFSAAAAYLGLKVGQVFEAASATMQFDVKITRIDENESGSITIHFMPVSEDVLYVSNEKFEVIIPKEKIKDVVYLEERLVYTATNGRQFVYVVDESGFKNPVYVEVDMVVEGMAIIKSGLEGGEEVTAK